jgi:hypothetical protein
VLDLAVQRVRGDERSLEVKAREHQGERGDLVGALLDLGLGDDDARALCHRAEQVHRAAVLAERAPHRFAVERRHQLLLGDEALSYLVEQPRADHRVELVRRDAPERSCDRAAMRCDVAALDRVVARPEACEHLLGQVGRVPRLSRRRCARQRASRT